eukprot:1967296-Prymnesium_polylepis.1
MVPAGPARIDEALGIDPSWALQGAKSRRPGSWSAARDARNQGFEVLTGRLQVVVEEIGEVAQAKGTVLLDD